MASLELGIKFIPSAGGTADFTPASTVQGFRPASTLTSGKTFRYRAENSAGTEWEYGSGVWNGTLLARTTIKASSTGSKVSFAAAPTVGIIQFVEDVLQFDDAMSLTNAQKAQAQINIGAREILTASRTYYFRSDGSDSNNGLANTAGGAFLTIQKALDTVGMLDTNTFDVTVQGGTTGTRNENLLFKSIIGGGRLILRGDPTTPSNYVLNSTTGSPIIITNAVGSIKLEGFKTTTSGGGSYHIRVNGAGTYVELGAWDFGSSAAGHINANSNGYIFSATSYTISGSASIHVAAGQAAIVSFNSPTITLTGTPAFSVFTNSENTSMVFFGAPTFSGAATGSRYNVTYNAVVGSYGSTLPGNAAGATSTGGQFF